MTAWEDVPVFGSREPGIAYEVRPSAYAIVDDGAGRIAVVHTPVGTFLPGVGIYRGETPAAAVVREVEEECGLVVRVGAWAESAVQLAWSPTYHAYYEKRSTFVEAVVERPGAPAVEADHVVEWLAPAAAAAAVSHESHAWAVRRWHGRARR